MLHMSVRIQGFEEFTDELDQLQERAESINGETEVSMAELFPPDFMQTYTNYESIAEFFERSPWTVETENDLQQIPEKKFDAYIDEHTGFSSWDAMLSAAAREWVVQQLNIR